MSYVCLSRLVDAALLVCTIRLKLSQPPAPPKKGIKGPKKPNTKIMENTLHRAQSFILSEIVLSPEGNLSCTSVPLKVQSHRYLAPFHRVEVAS